MITLEKFKDAFMLGLCYLIIPDKDDDWESILRLFSVIHGKDSVYEKDASLGEYMQRRIHRWNYVSFIPEAKTFNAHRCIIGEAVQWTDIVSTIAGESYTASPIKLMTENEFFDVLFS